MKKIFLVIALFALITFAFAGCGNKNEETDSEKNATDTVIAPGDNVYFFTDASGDAVESLADSLYDIVLKKKGGSVLKGSPGIIRKGIEILIDIEDETRPIIQKAKKILEREEEPNDIFCMRYVVYAHSGQLVFVCDENIYTKQQPIDYVLSSFVEKYLRGKESVTFSPGVVESGVIDLVAMQEIEDEKYLVEKWNEFDAEAKALYGNEVGGEITAAFQKYYSMFSDNVVLWWADLYDPGIGGFYYTNSGRNNLGYLPGIEATGQILTQLASSGIFSTIGGGVKGNLPPLMKYQIAYYLKSLQDPDGFFYNPQMGKEGSSSYRIGRDQGHAITRLVEFGGWPTYTCVYSGKIYDGDGLTADEWWDGLVADGLISADTPRPYVPKSLKDYEDYLKRGSLKATSARDAVSAVIAASSVGRGPSYFMSHADFEKWLNQWNPDVSPYSACSNMSAARSLILTDSEALGPANAPGKWYDKMTLMEMVIAYLNNYVNDKGLFGAYVDNGDPTAGCKFANTNGLMKAIGNYNAAGAAYPEPLKAVESCLIGIMGDEPSTTNICEVYNVWIALSGVLNNVKKYGTEEQKKYLFGTYDEITKTWSGGRISEALGRDGADAVINSYNKQKNYQCADGGFCHKVNGHGAGGSTNGEVPAGIGNIKESNVDAVCFGMTNTVDAMRSCFDIKTFVPVFTESDWMRFVERILELNPVIKDAYNTDVPKVYNFKNFEEADELPFGLSITGNPEAYGDYGVVGADGKDGKEGVLQINKRENGSGTSLNVQSVVNVKSGGCNMLTLEMDVKYTNVTENITSQVQFTSKGQAVSARPFLILLSSETMTDGSPIYYSEGRNDGVTAVKAFDSGAKIGEWFTLKVEYYEGNGETYRYKVYINGNLIYTSNAIYSAAMVKDLSQIPLASELDMMTFSMNERTSATLELDNIRLVQGTGTIDDLRVGKPGEEEIPDDRPDSDVPPVSIPAGITNSAAADAITYGEEVSDKIQKWGKGSANNNIYVADDSDGGKVLYIDKPFAGTMTVTQYPTRIDDNANVLVFEADIYPARYEVAGSFQISVNAGATSPADSPLLILLTPSKTEKGSTIRYTDYRYDKDIGSNKSNGSIDTEAVVGKWFRLRIEYKVTEFNGYGGASQIAYSTYINNNLVKTNTQVYGKNINEGGVIPTVEDLASLTFSINSANVGDFVIDNVSFRKLANNDYTSEKITISDSVIGSGIEAPAGALTFDRYLEYMLSSKTVKINNDNPSNKAEVILVSGDRMMSLKKNSSAPVEFIHYMKKAAVVEPSRVTYSTLMKLVTASNSGEAVISFLNKDGEAGAKIALSTDANGNVAVKAYKYTTSGETDSGIVVPTTAVKADEFFKLTVVYTMGKADNCLMVLLNNKVVLQGDYYIGAVNDGTVTDAHVTDVDGFSVKLEGNIIGEAILDYSHFDADPLPKDFVAENTNNGVIEFDKDYSKSVSMLVADRFAQDNTWEVVDLDGNKMLHINKTARDTVGSGGQVALNLKVTKNEVDSNKMIFEGKFKITNLTNADHLQFVLNSTSESPLLGLFKPSGVQNGAIIESQSRGVSKTLTSAKVGEWFTLRIEYWITDTDAEGNPTAIKYRYTVNNDTALVGTTVYKTAMKLSEIAHMNVSFNNANVGDLYIDDISLRLEKVDLDLEVDDPTPGEPGQGGGTTHKHSYENGRCECGAEDPNYVPTLTNGVITFDTPYSYYFKTSDTAQVNNSTVTEDNGNKCHQLVKTKGYNIGNYFHLAPTYVEEGATVAEVKFDIWASDDANLNTQLFFTRNSALGSDGPYKSAPFLSQKGNNIIKNLWNTVKIVYAPTSFVATDGADAFSAKVYVNDKLVDDIKTNYSIGKDNANIPTLEEIALFSFGFNSACTGTYRIDNASFKLLKEASK